MAAMAIVVRRSFHFHGGDDFVAVSKQAASVLTINDVLYFLLFRLFV